MKPVISTATPEATTSVTYYSTANLRATMVKVKDAIPQYTKMGVIYRLLRKGCDSKYVGETEKPSKPE